MCQGSVGKRKRERCRSCDQRLPVAGAGVSCGQEARMYSDVTVEDLAGEQRYLQTSVPFSRLLTMQLGMFDILIPNPKSLQSIKLTFRSSILVRIPGRHHLLPEADVAHGGDDVHLTGPPSCLRPRLPHSLK